MQKNFKICKEKSIVWKVLDQWQLTMSFQIFKKNCKPVNNSLRPILLELCGQNYRRGGGVNFPPPPSRNRIKQIVYPSASKSTDQGKWNCKHCTTAVFLVYWSFKKDKLSLIVTFLIQCFYDHIYIYIYLFIYLSI